MRLNRVLITFFFICTWILSPSDLRAQTTLNACYEGTCYPTLADAEAVMRSDPIYGVLFRQVSTRVANIQANSSARYIRYEVADQPPSAWYAPGYIIAGWAVYPLNCPPSESNPSLCAEEGPMVSQFAAEYMAPFPQCTWKNQRVAGSYIEPFRQVQSHYTGSSGNTGTLSFDNGGLPATNHRWEVDVNCPGWGTPDFDHRDFPISKVQAFRCAVGFYARDGFAAGYEPAGSTAVVAWPNLCWPATRFKEISVTLTQVASCSTNHPCHPTTGDKSRAEVDFSFAGRQFVRNYHSLRQLQWPSGYSSGWSHTYQERLEFYNVMPGLVTENGDFETFTSLGNDRFRANNSADRILVKRSDGTYKLTDGSSVVKIFSGSGLLLSAENLEDPNQDVILEYDGNKLLSVTDGTGRSILFSYTENRIESIVLPDGREIVYGYDGDGNLAEADYGGGEIKRYHYDEVGFVSGSLKNYLTGISQEDGARYASFTYDDSGRVIRSALQASGGAVEGVELTYNSDTSVSVKSASGDVRTLAVQPGLYRRVLGATDGSGTSTRTYDSEGRLKSAVDKRGIVTSFDYQASYLSQVSRAFGTDQEQRTSYVRDETNRLLRIDSLAWDGSAWVTRRTQSLAYDGEARLLAACITDVSIAGGAAYACGSIANAPVGVRQVKFLRCEESDVAAGACPSVGLVKFVDGNRSDVSDLTSYTYYPSDDASCVTGPTICPHRKGDLWKVTNAIGHTVEYLKYDGAGRVLSSKDANGVVTDLEYNPRGWLTASKVRGANNAVETDDVITRIEYWSTGLVKKVTQPDGAFTAYTYDAAHRLTDITDNAGNKIHYTLDAASNRTKEDTKDPANVLKRTLSLVYNQLGQLQTQADAQANPTDFTYDANGNADTVTDALGRVTDNNYDPLNRLSRTLQDVAGISAETKFQYDALDNLTQVTDPKGLNTDYTYNAFGDPVQLTSPDTGTTVYTYDSAGNRTSQTDSRGQVTTYVYDALNRLTTTQYTGASNFNIVYVYDLVSPNCPTDASFPVGRFSGTFDGNGDFTQYCYDRFGRMARKIQVVNGQNLTLNYAYTLSGQLRSVTYPDGTVADYVRNTLGRVTEVGVTRSGNARQVLLNQAAYAPFGPVKSWTYGNGRQLNRTYNQNYQPTAILDTAVGGLNLGFGFDAVGNLTELTPEASSVPLVNFDYDALSRLTAFRDASSGVAIESYTYDKTGNRLSMTNSAGTDTYDYPANSHRLTRGGWLPMTYDAAGNTASVAGSTVQYTYNAAGRMSEVWRNGVKQADYRYNGKGERVRKFLGTNNTYTLYDEAGHWLGDYGNGGAPLQQAIWLDDMPVGLLTNNQLQYVEPDHLGTPRLVIDPVRNVVVWKWDLRGEAFGSSQPAQDPDSDGTAFVLNLRYPGQQWDATSGLSYNYFRDYAAGFGRYVQSDPLGLMGGISTYGYSGGQPLNNMDPYGLLYGNGTFELEDAFFGPSYWMREQFGLDPSLPVGTVNSIAGFGDGLTGNITNSIRNGMGTNSAVDKCSAAYKGGQVGGVAYGLVLPVGRLAYVAKARQIPAMGLSAEASVIVRNGLKDYYRGPFAGVLSGWHAVTYEGLVASGKTSAEIIAGAGRTSVPWTAGILGSSAAATAVRASQIGGECGCSE